MIEIQKFLKIVFSVLSAGFFALGLFSAIGGRLDMAVLFGIAAVIMSLWEIATGLDVRIAQDDAK